LGLPLLASCCCSATMRLRLKSHTLDCTQDVRLGGGERGREGRGGEGVVQECRRALGRVWLIVAT
jgi:hypothetical protein